MASDEESNEAPADSREKNSERTNREGATKSDEEEADASKVPVKMEEDSEQQAAAASADAEFTGGDIKELKSEEAESGTTSKSKDAHPMDDENPSPNKRKVGAISPNPDKDRTHQEEIEGKSSPSTPLMESKSLGGSCNIPLISASKSEDTAHTEDTSMSTDHENPSPMKRRKPAVKWTPEEDEALLQAIFEAKGEDASGSSGDDEDDAVDDSDEDWDEIASKFSNKTSVQCFKRYLKLHRPTQKSLQVDWTDEETDLLKKLVEDYGDCEHPCSVLFLAMFALY